MKLRVLVIDDEECIRDTIKWHLEDQGHEVLTFSDPTEIDFDAICNQSNTCPCHILLTDFQMPKMNGIQFLKEVNKRDCKVIPENRYLITAYGNSIPTEEVEQIGCTTVHKPLSLRQLDELVLKAASRAF